MCFDSFIVMMAGSPTYIIISYERNALTLECFRDSLTGNNAEHRMGFTQKLVFKFLVKDRSHNHSSVTDVIYSFHLKAYRVSKQIERLNNPMKDNIHC